MAQKESKFNWSKTGIKPVYDPKSMSEPNDGEVITIPDMTTPISEYGRQMSLGILQPGKYELLFQDEDFDLGDVFTIHEIEKMDPMEAIELEQKMRANIRRAIANYKKQNSKESAVKNDINNGVSDGDNAPAEPGPVA